MIRALDANEWLDTDGDGIGNNAIRMMMTVFQIFRVRINCNPLLADSDADSYIDSDDLFPVNPTNG